MKSSFLISFLPGGFFEGDPDPAVTRSQAGGAGGRSAGEPAAVSPYKKATGVSGE